MGFLHEGHLSLVRESKKLTDSTVVSIFVNPTQFAPNEDLDKYPRDFEKDTSLLKAEKVDALFFPDVKEMYPQDHKTFVEVKDITSLLEGASRPTHFRGVTTIVTMLFNIVKPNRAFFGQKDAQQAAVLSRMTADLCMDIKIHICPIVRESDGLAMSSRNTYLSKKERKDALILSKSIKKAETLIEEGERNPQKIIKTLSDDINKVETSDLDYVQIVNADTFQTITQLEKNGSYFVLIACKIGKTRLIDNALIEI